MTSRLTCWLGRSCELAPLLVLDAKGRQVHAVDADLLAPHACREEIVARGIAPGNPRRGGAGEVRVELGVGEVAFGAAETRRRRQTLAVRRVVERRDDRSALEQQVQDR